MNRVEKKLYGFVGLDKTDDGKIALSFYYNDMFGWAISWAFGIVTDYEKPIQAYKHFYNYLVKNDIDFWDDFEKIKIPDDKTKENIDKYFTDNKIVYNNLIDTLKDYNDFTKQYLESEKFDLEETL